MPATSFIVLGVSHRVQGDPNFINAIQDPDYEMVVRQIMSDDGIDFVGEERSMNATTAERVAMEVLGSGRYANIDPDDRDSHGIGMTYIAPAVGALPVHRWIVAEQDRREDIWVGRMIAKTQSKGLLICGFLHALSVGFKILNRGFAVEARTYVPWERLGQSTK